MNIGKHRQVDTTAPALTTVSAGALVKQSQEASNDTGNLGRTLSALTNNNYEHSMALLQKQLKRSDRNGAGDAVQEIICTRSLPSLLQQGLQGNANSAVGGNQWMHAGEIPSGDGGLLNIMLQRNGADGTPLVTLHSSAGSMHSNNIGVFSMDASQLQWYQQGQGKGISANSNVGMPLNIASLDVVKRAANGQALDTRQQIGGRQPQQMPLVWQQGGVGAQQEQLTMAGLRAEVGEQQEQQQLTLVWQPDVVQPGQLSLLQQLNLQQQLQQATMEQQQQSSLRQQQLLLYMDQLQQSNGGVGQHAGQNGHLLPPILAELVRNQSSQHLVSKGLGSGQATSPRSSGLLPFPNVSGVLGDKSSAKGDKAQQEEKTKQAKQLQQQLAIKEKNRLAQQRYRARQKEKARLAEGQVEGAAEQAQAGKSSGTVSSAKTTPAAALPAAHGPDDAPCSSAAQAGAAAGGPAKESGGHSSPAAAAPGKDAVARVSDSTYTSAHAAAAATLMADSNCSPRPGGAAVTVANGGSPPPPGGAAAAAAAAAAAGSELPSPEAGRTPLTGSSPGRKRSFLQLSSRGEEDEEDERRLLERVTARNLELQRRVEVLAGQVAEGDKEREELRATINMLEQTISRMYKDMASGGMKLEDVPMFAGIKAEQQEQQQQEGQQPEEDGAMSS